jgi:hypothetical protein
MNIIKIIFVAIVLFGNIPLSAQLDTCLTGDGKYCVPSLKGVPVGKGFSIEYQRIPNVAITTNDETGQYEDTKNTIKSITSLEARLKIPVFHRPYLTILTGLKYTIEEYHFENSTSNPLYQNLEDKGLKSAGANLTIIKPSKSKHFWVLNASADFNGDFDNKSSILNNYLKFSVSPAIGWKINDHFSYALGISYNYRFGKPLLLPVIAFNKNFNERWGVEAVLPVYVRSRYKYNAGLYWLNTIEIDGASYRLNQFTAPLSEYTDLYLHRSNVQLTSRVEKRIAGWLWIATEVGLRENIVLNLSNSNQTRKNVIFDTAMKPAALFNISLFLSPPKLR